MSESDSNSKVSITRYVKQVEEDKYYNGYVKVLDAKFDYELEFSIPISQLNASSNYKEHRRVFRLIIKKDGKRIKLSDKEYELFLAILVDFIVHFCSEIRINDLFLRCCAPGSPVPALLNLNPNGFKEEGVILSVESEFYQIINDLKNR